MRAIHPIICLLAGVVFSGCTKKEPSNVEPGEDYRTGWEGNYQGEYLEVRARNVFETDTAYIKSDSLSTNLVINVKKDPNNKTSLILSLASPQPDSLMIPNFWPISLEVDSAGTYWRTNSDTYNENLYLRSDELVILWDHLYFIGDFQYIKAQKL